MLVSGDRQGAFRISRSATCAVRGQARRSNFEKEQWSQGVSKLRHMAQSCVPDGLCLGSFRLVLCFDCYSPSGALVRESLAVAAAARLP